MLNKYVFSFLIGIFLLQEVSAAPNLCANIFKRVIGRQEQVLDPQAPSGFVVATQALAGVRQMTRADLKQHPAVEDILKNSIEVLFKETPPFGHIQLRVGKRLYAFNYIMSTVRADFNINALSAGTVGGLKLVDAAEIEKFQNEIEEFYKSSAANNVPPFDAFSPLVELDTNENLNGYVFKTPSEQYGASSTVRGEVVTENNKKYLKSSSGFNVEIVERGGKMYVQSYSCSTSASHVLKKYFNIYMPPYGGARDLLFYMRNSTGLVIVE